MNKAVSFANENYILVTPAKNEEENLPKLIASIFEQKLLPVAWFFVEDGSTDHTPNIISDLCLKIPWIHSLTINNTDAYGSEEKYAFVCRECYNYAFNYCKKNDINFGYVALADADIILPSNYFYDLIEYLIDNQEYGIVSGERYIMNKNKYIYKESEVYEGITGPHGSGRLWRRSAFEETDGYIITGGPDAVSNLLAVLRGWKVKQLPSLVCYQIRDTGGKISLWNGYFSRGRRQYYLGRNPLGIFNDVIDIIFISKHKKCILKSISYIAGYANSFINKDTQIENEEIKSYFGSYAVILSNYKLYVKNKIYTRS